MKRKVLIIGGGIRGLVAAWELQKKGIPYEIWERSGRVGGAVQSYSKNGYIWEAGPNTLMHKPEEMSGLLAELDLENRAITPTEHAKKRYIVKHAQPLALPSSPLDFFTNSALSVFAKLRLLTEPFRKNKGKADESLASFVERRLGREVLDYLVNPFVSGIYAGDPQSLSVRHAFPRLDKWEKENGSIFKGLLASKPKKAESHEKARMLSFPNGLEELVLRLKEKSAQQIQVSKKISSIRVSDEHRFEIFADGQEVGQEFSDLVITSPAHACALLPWEEHLYKQFQRFDQITHPAVDSLFIAFKKTDVSHPLDGFGLLAPQVESRNILGVLFSSSLFVERCPEDEVALTVFLGGVRHPETRDLSEKEILDLVLPELRNLLGVRGVPTFYDLSRWSKAIPQYEVGHQTYEDAAKSLEKNHPGIHILSNFRGGISLGQSVQYARQRVSDGF